MATFNAPPAGSNGKGTRGLHSPLISSGCKSWVGPKVHSGFLYDDTEKLERTFLPSPTGDLDYRQGAIWVQSSSQWVLIQASSSSQKSERRPLASVAQLSLHLREHDGLLSSVLSGHL